MEIKNISFKQSFYKDHFFVKHHSPKHCYTDPKTVQQVLLTLCLAFKTYNTFSVFVPICTLMDAPERLLFAGMNPAFYVLRKIPKVKLFF